MSREHLMSLTKPMMRGMRLILKVRVSPLMSIVRIVIFRCFHAAEPFFLSSSGRYFYT